MAIDQTSTPFIDNQLMFSEEMRQAPTPELHPFDENLETFDEIFHNSTYLPDFDFNSTTYSPMMDGCLPVDPVPAPNLVVANNATPFNIFSSSSMQSFASETTTTQAPVSLSGKTKGKKGKCMSRNAIAARQNREKKKQEKDYILKNYQMATQEMTDIKNRCTALTAQNEMLRHRNDYLESVAAHIPQIISLMEHVKTTPIFPKIGDINLHHDTEKDDVLQKLGLDPNQISAPGICFHLKGPKDISLHFCHHCASSHANKAKTKPHKPEPN